MYGENPYPHIINKTTKIGGFISSKDNSYANTDKKTLFLSDDVDNESIGKLTWSILQQIREDDEKDEKEKDYKREPIKLYINSYGGSVL